MPTTPAPMLCHAAVILLYISAPQNSRRKRKGQNNVRSLHHHHHSTVLIHRTHLPLYRNQRSIQHARLQLASERRRGASPACFVARCINDNAVTGQHAIAIPNIPSRPRTPPYPPTLAENTSPEKPESARRKLTREPPLPPTAAYIFVPAFVLGHTAVQE